ncbi:MAG: IS630 family transposase [Verrucomicrobia bacterium]|nr:IS630 family transposase [Verrucomicrobiota bacterium]
MDEGRFGRISDVRACWAPSGSGRRSPGRWCVNHFTLFAAVAPKHGIMNFTLSPKCNTASMSLFLLELLAAWPDQRLLLFLDGAGWHKSRQLPIPERLRLVYLPPYTPECNPSEHLWDELREKGFANQFFATLDAVEVQLKTQLELLAADSIRLRSLTAFPWIIDWLLYL